MLLVGRFCLYDHVYIAEHRRGPRVCHFMILVLVHLRIGKKHHLIWWKSTRDPENQQTSQNWVQLEFSEPLPWFLGDKVTIFSGFVYSPAFVWAMRLEKGSVALCTFQDNTGILPVYSWAVLIVRDENSWAVDNHVSSIFRILNDEQMSDPKWGWWAPSRIGIAYETCNNPEVISVGFSGTPNFNGTPLW